MMMNNCLTGESMIRKKKIREIYDKKPGLVISCICGKDHDELVNEYNELNKKIGRGVKRMNCKQCSKALTRKDGKRQVHEKCQRAYKKEYMRVYDEGRTR